MKKIEAVVFPNELEKSWAALAKGGISNMMVYEIREYGKTAKHKEIYRNDEYTIDSMKKCKVETIVPYNMVSRVIEIITASRKSQKGEGETIFVTPVNDANG